MMQLGQGTTLVAFAVLAYGGYLCLDSRRRNPAGLPYPPGPPGYPIIGNLLDIPKVFIYKRFREMSRELGSDIIHLQVFRFHLIVCNAKEVVDDLFEKRSSIYSDRPRMPMLCELMGFGWSLGFTPYNEWWKHSRALFHKHFKPTAVAQFRPMKLKVAHEFLQRLLDDPKHFHEHMKLMAGGFILDVGYGLDIQSADDPYIKRATKTLAIIDKAGNPGAFLVDSLPALKHVPEWVPGATFKRKAREWSVAADEFGSIPFDFVKEGIRQGIAKPSFVSIALQDITEKDDRQYQEALIKALAGTMYTAGADTTVSLILTFFLAMLKFPEVQAKAQEELDRVVGTDSLPTFEDEPHLPYVGALVKEVFRWQQVAPFAIPHRVSVDDVYRGYFIPRDSIVLGNAWALLHDDALFPDPFLFKPERFGPDADPAATETVGYAFGFGRRFCPGRWMAQSFTWITIANVLAAFTLEKTRDASGNFIEPNAAYSPGILATPEKFDCIIKPRSHDAELLIRSAS